MIRRTIARRACAACLFVAMMTFGVTLARGDTIYLLGSMDESGVIGDTYANPGEDANVSFFYIDPTNNIQGYSIAVCFDCALAGEPGSFNIDDTFLVTVGAEFISQQVDNDPNDGDGCELIIGILLDALPPFDGQTMPPTILPLKIGTYSFFVPPDVPCFTDFPVQFCQDINGAGTVLVSNVVVIDNLSITPALFVDNDVSVPADSLFVRGDANDDGIVNVADVVFILNYLTQSGLTPDCLDAADINNDGLLNISDALYLTLYIFLNGLPPKEPFPACGLEPVPDTDTLGCTGPLTACPYCP